MTGRRTGNDYAARADELIETFFGPGNPVWPNRDPDSIIGRRLVPYLQVLHEGSDVPIVLPRQDPETRQWVAYVIPLDERHGAAMGELLQAFIGTSFARFHGQPARLNPEDPIDRAVLRFAGHSSVFVISSPRSAEKHMWDAVKLLQQAVRIRPRRSWHAPTPVGRLLSQFDIAMAAGDNAASASLLEQLSATGGLSATNVAYLRIKRLARLGRNAELLRLAELPDVATTRPPTPVRDAILAAIFVTALAEPLAAGELETARARLIEAGTLVPALMDGPLAELSPEALTVLALAAPVMDNTPITELLRNQPGVLAALEPLAPDLAAQYLHARPSEATNEVAGEANGEGAGTTIAAPTSWLELARAVAADSDIGEVLADERWRLWPPAAETDDEVASVLGRLDDAAADRVWALVGPFVDADRYLRPAARSAREFLTNALTHDRFTPGDLAGIVALAEIVLRSAPDSATYAQLLDDLAAEASRWAGPDRAPVVLDLVDLVARSACPDADARLRVGYRLLRPLSDHSTRLDHDQAGFAAQLSIEVGVELPWPPTDEEVASPWSDVPAQDLLLYSLDESVLDRVTTALAALVPQVNIITSHDHVGSRQLKQWVRRADVVVMATRCATHAATGFIRSNSRPMTLIREADGSGSASLLRAATAALNRGDYSRG
ncbi:protein DpdD [Micromonospora sp. NPDC049497]|uniref:protein DpdD n=1 Tax=Micromonospora sp. NPDC049497 TaxID=3364273 RepID=UPI0037BAA241